MRNSKNKVNDKKRTKIAQQAVKIHSFRFETVNIIAKVDELYMRT
jgi:hypothetical protein